MEDVGVASSQDFLLQCHPQCEQSVAMATPQLLSLPTSTLAQAPGDNLVFPSPLLPYSSVLPLDCAPPSTPPHPSPPITGHRSYTLEFKLSVVDWILNSKASIRAASKQFGVDRKLIRTWLNSKDTLSSALATHGPNRRKLHSGARPLSEAVDQYVLQYLGQQRQAGIQVVEKDLQLKALEYAESLGLSSFKATSTWVRGWKHRHSVEWRNGTYEVVQDAGRRGQTSVHVQVRGSALLSHVNARDRVKLPVTKGTEDREQYGEREEEGGVACAVVLDFSAKEHSYAKPERLAPPPSLIPPPASSYPSPVLDGDHASLLSYLSPHLESPPYGMDAFIDSSIVGGVSALELPLGHEEVVTDCEYSSPQGKKHTSSSRKSSRGRGRARRSISNSSLAVSPTSVATFPCVDDGGGLGGMLANRLSQPVFPAGPEIVYVDAPLSAHNT